MFTKRRIVNICENLSEPVTEEAADAQRRGEDVAFVSALPAVVALESFARSRAKNLTMEVSDGDMPPMTTEKQKPRERHVPVAALTG